MTRKLQPVQSSPPKTSSETRRLLEQRIRELDAFVEAHGLDYWYRDDGGQLALDEGRAA
jgi:hypothetical protein